MDKRAVIYARVSTDEQAGELTTSLNDQVRFCTEYAERNGFEVVRVYQDDYTGRVRNRPALRELESDLNTTKIDAIIAWNHKRIARYWPLGIGLLSDWAQRGVEVHVVSDGGKIDFANWGIVIAMLGQVESHKDSNEIREKTSRGRNRQVEEFGRVMTLGHPPYGYKIVNKGLKKQSYYAIDEYESEVVKMIFQWYTVGDESGIPLTLDAIGKRLDNMGIQPPRPPKKNITPEWRSSTLARILQNELYTGVFSWGKTRMVRESDMQDRSKRVKMPKEEWIRVDMPQLALVDKATFEAALNNLSCNREFSKRHAKREYLLSGFFFCGGCGRRMTGYRSQHKLRSDPDKSRTHICYICTSHASRFPECSQSHRNISINIADSIVWGWLYWLLNDEQVLISGIKSMGGKEEGEVNEKRQRLERLDISIDDINRRINGLIDDLAYFRQNGCSQDTINSIRKHIEECSSAKEALVKDRGKIERELAEQTVSQENIDQVMSFVKEIKNRLPNATFQDKRYLLRLFDVKGKYISNGDDRRLDVECAIPAFNQSFELHHS